MAVLEGMDLDGKSDVSKDGKSINTQLDYSLKSLKVQNQDLGTGKLSLKIGNIDGRGVARIQSEIQQREPRLC